MSDCKILIGLITHRGSRFNSSGESESALTEFAAALAEQGLNTSLLVSDRDDYTPDAIRITRRLLFTSSVFQVWLEFRWRRYLAAGRGDRLRSLPKDALILAAMTIRRLLSYVGLNPFRPGNRMPGAKQVVRLLNIDLSHLRVYREALENECDGVLVIEDDARVSSVNAASTAIFRLLDQSDRPGLKMANLSESIDLQTLGVKGIVEEEAAEGMAIVACSRPVTNTVCANLFNAEFTRALCEDVERRGLTPVVPIDWRLNRFVMSAWKRELIDSRSCVWVVPGIFVQGSMHIVL